MPNMVSLALIVSEI